MNVSLRVRLLGLIFTVLAAAGLVNGLVVQPRYRDSVIGERKLLLSQQQARDLALFDERVSGWTGLLQAASVQISRGPQHMETVFTQYLQLFPDLVSISVSDVSTGDFVEIRRPGYEAELPALQSVNFYPVRMDPEARFAWIRPFSEGGAMLLVRRAELAGRSFQLLAVFDDSRVAARMESRSDGLYEQILALEQQVIYASSEGAALPVGPSSSIPVAEEDTDSGFLHLRAGSAIVPLAHIIRVDVQRVREPVEALFRRTTLISFFALLLLMAGGWGLVWVVERPVKEFIEDTRPWGDLQFTRPLRSGSLPELKNVTAALEGIRRTLLRYQEINVEKMIVEQEKNLQLMRFASEMVALLDGDGRFVFINRKLEQLFTDLSGAEAPASLQSFLSLSTVKISPRSTDTRAQSAFTVITEGFELTAQTAAGEYIMGGERIALAAPDGRTLGAMLFLHDLTEDRRIDRMRNEMIDLIVHELRNPVTGIVGLSELLATAKLDEKTKKEFYGLIRNAGQTMAQLINRFLDISRLESNRLVMKKESRDLTDLVREAAAGFTAQMQQKKLQISIRSGSRPCMAEVSPDLMADAIRNLLANAIKYGPESRTIDVALSAESNRMIIAVTDYGYGIAPEHLDKVFQKFYRIRDPRITEVGTGLGLPYVKEIVEKHGGSLRLESDPAFGCRFSIMLPAKPG